MPTSPRRRTLTAAQKARGFTLTRATIAIGYAANGCHPKPAVNWVIRLHGVVYDMSHDLAGLLASLEA